MEQQYFNASSATGLATTIAFLAVSLVPSGIYPIQSQEANSYEQYAKIRMPEYDRVHLIKDEESKILVSFAQMLLDNSKEDDSEIAKITSDGFWEFHENF
jgi:hypothetical protein